jgi:hypothetical protein
MPYATPSTSRVRVERRPTGVEVVERVRRESDLVGDDRQEPLVRVKVVIVVPVQPVQPDADGERDDRDQGQDAEQPTRPFVHDPIIRSSERPRAKLERNIGPWAGISVGSR